MTPEEWRRIFERLLKKTKQQLLQK
jgi:hypothetical protein